MKKIYQLIRKNILSSSFFRPSKKPAQAKQLPIITISREMGSGGRPIAHLVAKKLGKSWKVYHKDIVDQIAEETHLEKKLVGEIDENKIPLIETVIGDFFGRRHPTLSTYNKHLVKILSTIGQRGCAVIVGRGAEYLLPHALKVRIICEMEQRIRWLTEFEKISRMEAIKRIQESDKKRLEFVRTLYQHDLRKAHHYDLVIRTGPNLSIEDAADLIVQAAKKRFRL